MSEPELFEAEHFKRYAPKGEGVLGRLEAQANEMDIPIIGPVLGRLLYLLARATGARRVLELGTATGYSAIMLARAVSPGGGKVVTIEWDAECARAAQENIAKAGHSDAVEVMEGDAKEIMSKLEGNFDMIFCDVEKEFYSELLDPCVALLRSGGLMVHDNTAFKSAGDFLERSFHHPRLEAVHLYALFPDHSPDFDAITISVKR